MGRHRWPAPAVTLAVALLATPAVAAIDGRGAPAPTAAAIPARGAPTPAVPTRYRVTTGGVAPVGGRVVRPFDPPATPYGRGHRGVDLAARPGEPVRAALAGTVTFAGQIAGVTWVTVAHADGLTTTYGGLDATVRAGQEVALGAPIGAVGDRARLDWGARRDGRYLDPLLLLGGWRAVLVPVARGRAPPRTRPGAMPPTR